MNKTLVPFSEIHHFSNLISDYLEGSEPLQPFYEYRPEPDSFLQAIETRKKFSCNRQVLVDAIMKQYSPIFSTTSNGVDNVKKSISLLGNENCFTVTTGHQLNIFTGPLFAIYKILTTIKLSRVLAEKYPSFTFVPVFWMASEDHDFEEINHIHLYGKKVAWNREPAGAVGRMDLGGMEQVIKEAELLSGENADCISIFKQAYLDSSNLAEATRSIMHELFSKYSLVIVDGDDASLKRLFIKEMRDDLKLHTAYKEVMQTSGRLSKIHKIQVQPREINLFYLGKNARNRIEKQPDGTYVVLNTELRFSEKEILIELESHPENFSPNVVLRPVYQEKILPNLAYTGGPGELNYWLQFKDTFKALEVPFPVFIPRNCMLLVPQSLSEKAKKLGITQQELFLSTDYMLLKVLEKSSEVHVGTESIAVLISREFEKLGKDWMSLDASLVSGIEAEKQRMLNSLASLEEKARRALKRKNETLVSQVKNFKEKLFPGGGLQERHENLLTYSCRYGANFLDEIYDQVDPFEKQFIVLSDF